MEDTILIGYNSSKSEKKVINSNYGVFESIQL